MGKDLQHSPPLLLTSHGPKSEKQSFYNLLEDRYHTTAIPILLNKSVLCSAYGWFLLIDQYKGESQRQCCLLNPTSLEIIQLPPVENRFPFNRCFLSKPPTEPDCFILFNHFNSVAQIVCRVQDNAFFKLNLLKKGYQLLSMVSFQGMIYGIIKPKRGSKYEFVTIRMVGKKFETKPILSIDDKLPWEVPQPVRSFVLYNMDYLFESPCGNELLLVTKMVFNADFESNMHFRVFRVDVGRTECEELDNLDGRTIFISFYGNGICRFSESFGAAIKPNSIYYTNENGKVMYVYDLDDRSTITLMPYPDVDMDQHRVDNYWVDLPDIAMKNSLYFRVSR